MKRLPLLVVLAGLVLAPAMAVADTGLEELLEEASSAEFHGDGIVLCTWGSDSAAARYDITRSDGMSMVHGPEGALMSAGGLMATGDGSAWYGLEVGEWSEWALHERYTVSEPVPIERLGRPAASVTVFEEGRPRALIVLDAESAVPLLTEIYSADGTLFRVAALLDFRPGPSDMADAPGEFEEMEHMDPALDTGALPAEASGYRRADAYSAPGGVQGFYTDGLFSFSVFESKRGSTPDAFADATAFRVEGETYRRIVTPSHVWVQWHSPDRTYVLVGDLPPDHIAAVLPSFPEPGDRAFFVRLWRRLFG
jgi:hypothetical protein